MNEPYFLEFKKLPTSTRINYQIRYWLFKALPWLVVGITLTLCGMATSKTVGILEILKYKKGYYRLLNGGLEEIILGAVLIGSFFGIGGFFCWAADHAQKDFWDAYIEKLKKNYPQNFPFKTDLKNE